MLNRIQKRLQQDCGLSPQQKTVVGVSGGADSLCLLDILVRLQFPVVVTHFNHLLRPEAREDAHTVELIATQYGVPFILGEGATPDYAQEHSLSIEAAARELRYRFIFEQAEKNNAQAVIVAHTADDQVETVLMHLLRGTGLDGLTGMLYRALPNSWSDNIPLVRPLLEIWRTEIVEYCTERSLTPRIDATNADTTYFRNRLRHDLIPELESYVPGFRNRLWQTANLLAADRISLEELTDRIWQDVHIGGGFGYEIFNLESFNLQSLALRRRLVRRAISHLRPGARDVGFALVQRALDFSDQPTATGQVDLGLGLCITKENEGLLIAAWEADLPNEDWPQINEPCPLKIPGEVDLGNGWVVRAEVLLDVEAARLLAHKNRDPYRAWIDLGERKSSLKIRSRRPGDCFHPLGMHGRSMKISDFMVNEKIPQRARASWPLISAGDEIAWIPGYRMGESFRLTPASRHVVKLALIQSGKKL